MISNVKYAESLVIHTLENYKTRELVEDLGIRKSTVNDQKEKLKNGTLIPTFLAVERYAKFNGMSVTEAFINPDILFSTDIKSTLKGYSPNNIRVNISRLIKGHGYNTHQVSLISGIPDLVIRDYKYGDRKRYPRTLQRIADALEIEIIDFFKPSEGGEDN